MKKKPRFANPFKTYTFKEKFWNGKKEVFFMFPLHKVLLSLIIGSIQIDTEALHFLHEFIHIHEKSGRDFETTESKVILNKYKW